MLKQKIDKRVNQIKLQSKLRISKKYIWSQDFEFGGDIPVKEEKLKQCHFVYGLIISDTVYQVSEQFALWYQWKLVVTDEQLISLFEEFNLVENN